MLSGLLILPACSMPSSLQRQNHVYSTLSPRELDRESEPRHTAQAVYPDDENNALQEAAGSDSSVDSADSVSVSDPAAESGVTQADDGGRYPFARIEQEPLESPVIPVAFQSSEAHATPAGFVRGSHATFHAAEPRQPLPEPAFTGLPQQVVGGSPLAEMYPDEYVFDGGDRGEPVHYFGTTRRGFETEDTIAEFRDHDGKNHVKASNRVAVYAPRFGSVRTITGPGIDVKVEKAHGSTDLSTIGNLHIENALMANVQDTPLLGVDARSRADGVETNLNPEVSKQSSRPSINRKVDQGMEGVSFINVGTLEMDEGAIISEQMQNALTWTRDQFPQLSASTSQSADVYSRIRVQATVGVEDNRKTKGQVRLIKLADRDTAVSGEVLTFTIHFENLGDFDVHDVRIVDNLTPRLQYVDGSAQTDALGEVIITPNGEGSQTLTFKLEDGLKGHESGTIQFQTRVR